MSLSNVFNIAGSGLNAQSVRLNTTASNIANAEAASSSSDQVYKGRHPVFAASYHAAMGQDKFGFPQQNFEDSNDESVGVAVMGIVESDAPLQQRYEPGHPMANEEGYVFYPNVNVVEEMTNMISASRSYQVNVELMNSAKQMLQSVLQLGQ